MTGIPDISDITCDFESDQCGWYADSAGTFSWRRHQRYTPTYVTGK